MHHKVAPAMSARYNVWEVRGSLSFAPHASCRPLCDKSSLLLFPWLLGFLVLRDAIQAVSQPGATGHTGVAEIVVHVGPGCQRDAGPGRGVCNCAASGGARRQLGTSCQHHRLHLQVTTVHFVHSLASTTDRDMCAPYTGALICCCDAQSPLESSQ